MGKDISNRRDTGRKDDWGRPIYEWDNNADKKVDSSLVNSNPGNDFVNNESDRNVYSDERAFKYLLDNGDIDEIIDGIEELETPEDVSYHYNTMNSATAKAPNSDDGEKIIIAYAENDNTPSGVLDDLGKVGNKYHDLYYGLSSKAALALRENPNASQELKDTIFNNMSKYLKADDNLSQQRQENEHAQKEFEKDPELKSRLKNVREKNVYGDLREMVFDPKDVEKVGVDYVAKNYVHLFGATYNENTGTFRGYID